MENIIENFSVESIKNYFWNKLSDFKQEEEDFSEILKENEAFSDLEKLGEVELSDGKDILFFACKSEKDLSERSGKKIQYDIAKRLMQQEMKDSAIAIFYDDKGDFRFSFIRRNYGGDEKFSSWKRYSYFVSKNQTNKTFLDRIKNADFSSLEKIQEAFSVEKLTKDFYNDLFKWFSWTLTEEVGVTFPNDTRTSNDDKEKLEEKLENTTGRIVWANDNEHFFYIRKNEHLRAYKIYRHRLGTSQEEDVLVFHEEDEAFDVSVFKTKSLEYIFIASSSTVSDEHRFIPAADVFAEWRIVQPRKEGLEYVVEHYENDFYILTNEGGDYNFKLVKTSVDTPYKENWVEVIPHRKEVLLEGFEIFKNYLVLEEREKGLLQLNIFDYKNKTSWYLPFNDPTYTAYIGLNLEFDTEILRYGYTSLTMPSSTYEYNMREKTVRLLKQQEVLGGKFLSENYISERIWTDSRDGEAKIPISLVYHKDTLKSEKTPLLLYGYGSYGHTVDASFSSVRLSLLDRGFIYAIAHIRGGEYLGRDWYENGKMLKKKNTFYDFIDAAKFLIKENYTSSNHLYAMGGSAGGLLMGVVINEESELFNGIVAQVPFVDVVTTMLDESIPLTTGEYDEWGNPNDKEYYEYMKVKCSIGSLQNGWRNSVT